METEEKIVSVENIFDGKIIKVRRFVVTLPDGSSAFREEVCHGGGAAALVYDGENVFLVSQFRLAAERDLLEIPAGKLEKGEDPESAIRRELVEEVGIVAGKLKKISSFYASPGYTNEVIHVYFCDDFTFTDQKLDAGEFLNVRKIPAERGIAMVESGDIADAKTVVSLLYLKNLLKDDSL